ncbi:MAG TPA: tetratricopeptide repeat protein [Chthoniobacteraceae bacterium]|jgi:tetratricopeptide (TPR) repeat protein|nr:tetratricopeptide repeat protein [Chthoniobacteraceae bacterium]
MGRSNELHPLILASIFGYGTNLFMVDPGADLLTKLACGVVTGSLGYAINRLAARRDSLDPELPLSAEEVGLNHHLARLAAHALRSIIDAEAKRLPAGSPSREALVRAVPRAEPCWLAVLQAPSGGEFRRVDLGDIAAGHAIAPGGVEVLDAKTWEPFARFVLQGKDDPAPPADLAAELAKRFEQEFAAHFHEHAKASLEKDPPAFAALLLQFHAELRFTQHAHTAAFAHLGGQMDALAAKLDTMAAATVRLPGFDWTKLTLHLAETETFHAEFRAFFQSAGQRWDELLPQVRQTLLLLQEVHGPQHRQLLTGLAGLNLLIHDQVLPLIREVQQHERDRYSGASIILDLLRVQRERDAEARRGFEAFALRREDIQGRGGHHYHQPDRWTPGHRTRKLWREAGTVFVPRPPLLQPGDVPEPGTNLYLYGESGHGKSLLAANIADRLLHRGYRALTFNLRQPGDILRHLALLADKEWLGLDAPPGTPPEKWDDAARIVAAITWLLELPDAPDPLHPPYCLVWDNADDLVTLDHLFRLQLLHHRGVQIITSRIHPLSLSFEASHPCHDWPPARLKLLHVKPYNESEAIAHLREAWAKDDDASGEIPPHEVRGVLLTTALRGDPAHFDPLKLDDVARRLRQTGWDFELVLHPEPGFFALTGEVAVAGRSHAEVLAETVAALPPLARIVWRLLVHLAPAPIPEEYWGKMDSFLRDTPDVSATERAEIDAALRARLPIVQARAALAEAGLLTGGDEGDLVHTRHHALGREQVEPAERPAAYRMALRFLHHVAPAGDPYDDVSLWPSYRAAEPHLLAVLSAERHSSIVALSETGWLTYRFTSYLFHQARLAEAEAVAQLDLESSLAVNGANSPNHATSLHELAGVHLAQGRSTEAEQGLREALEIYRQHHGDRHLRVAAALHELARVHLAQGRYIEAEQGFRQTLEIERQLDRERHPGFSTTLHALACVHSAQGRYTEAEQGFRQALEISRQHLGEKHPALGLTLHELARVHLAQGRYTEAEQGYRQALEIARQHFGEMHPAFATTLHSLARVHLAEGRYTEAEAGFRQALEIYRETRGEASREPAVTRGQLARLLWKSGKEEDSKALFARALQDMGAALGRKHDRIAEVLHNWAECELGAVSEAEPLVPAPAALQRAERALEIRRRVFGEDHPDVAATLLLSAEGRRRSGDLDGARADVESAGPMLAAALPAEHVLNQQARALIAALA